MMRLSDLDPNSNVKGVLNIECCHTASQTVTFGIWQLKNTDTSDPRTPAQTPGCLVFVSNTVPT